jgi:ribosomal protein S18 acetylase RimI-like enzyme
MDPSELSYFKWLVQTYVSHYYPETEESYTETLASFSLPKERYEGVSTVARRVWSIEVDGSVAGYFVGSEKTEGGVKLGPIVLAPEFRRKRIGGCVLNTLARHYSQMGFWKFYMTVPASNVAANSFARESGFCLETILRKHYSESHDEYVWGRTISETFDTSKMLQSANGNAKHLRLSAQTDRLESTSKELGSGHEYLKQRRLYQHDLESNGPTILCSPKRGGALKLDFLNNGNKTEVLAVLDEIESYFFCRSRKLYTMPLVSTESIIKSLIVKGYTIEGTIRRQKRDAGGLILSKLTS